MKQQTMSRIICAILTLSLLASFAGCGRREAKTPDPTFIRKTIEELAVDYGAYGAEAKDRTDALLEALYEADPVTGARWQSIMQIWMSEDLGQPLNYDVLPDGLPDTDELCIVVLGFQLNPDGSMREELVQRMTARLAMERLPGSLLFLSSTVLGCWLLALRHLCPLPAPQLLILRTSSLLFHLSWRSRLAQSGRSRILSRPQQPLPWQRQRALRHARPHESR